MCLSGVATLWKADDDFAIRLLLSVQLLSHSKTYPNASPKTHLVLIGGLAGRAGGLRQLHVLDGGLCLFGG